MTERKKPEEARNHAVGRPLALDGPVTPRAPDGYMKKPLKKKKQGGSVVFDAIRNKQKRIAEARASGEIVVTKDLRHICRIFAYDALAVVAAAIGGEGIPYSIQLKAAELILGYAMAKPLPTADENEVSVQDPVSQLVAILSGSQTQVVVHPLPQEDYEAVAVAKEKEKILDEIQSELEKVSRDL